ncbi:MAG: alpha/beta fold hydrolase [Pirellulales bacterium]|nr:alpha/beta fold hydrolase [Pirellulales bacterium]
MKSDWRALYPFTSHYLRLDGHAYHYLDEGRGEPLLLVHGNPTWSFYWRELILGLRDAYRVVVPDHMGCGLSDKPRGYPYRFVQHAENLTRLIRALDLDRVTLVVHDWGGPIGLRAALAEPHRFARYVLFNTAAFRSRQVPWRIGICRWPIVGRLAVQGLNAFVRAATWMAVSRPLSPAARAGLVAPYNCWRNREAVWRFVQDIPLTPSHPSFAPLCELEAALPRLRRQPMLIVWGMRDWCFTPAFLARFQELFPHAQIHPLHDASHYLAEDAHEQIVPLLRDFLRRHASEADTHGRSETAASPAARTSGSPGPLHAQMDQGCQRAVP